MERSGSIQGLEGRLTFKQEKQKPDKDWKNAIEKTSEPKMEAEEKTARS